MKGRALKLFRDFQAKAEKEGQGFAICRVILLARVIPERLTEEQDDPELERRIERAIEAVRASTPASTH
jgi:hypothetical protein